MNWKKLLLVATLVGSFGLAAAPRAEAGGLSIGIGFGAPYGYGRGYAGYGGGYSGYGGGYAGYGGGYGYGRTGYYSPSSYSSYGYSPYGYYQPSYVRLVVRPHYHWRHGHRYYCTARHRHWR